MREKLKKIFLFCMALLFFGYLLFSGIHDLTDKENLYTIRLDGAIPILEVEHSINGLIPVGKDHYYFGMEDETYDACIFKASPRWYKKHFDEETGMAYGTEGVTITALEKRAGKYDLQKELSARAAQMEGVNYITSPGYALELDYKVNAVCKLALLVLFVGLALVGVIFVKNSGSMNKIAGRIYGVVWLLWAVLLLKVLL